MMYVFFLFLIAFPAVNYLAASPVDSPVFRAFGNDESLNKATKPSHTKPCAVQISGPWADVINITAEPNPPRTDKLLKFTFNFSFKEDTQSLKAIGAMTFMDSGIYWDFDDTICDFVTSTHICPAMKGESRYFEKELFIGYIPKATYSIDWQVTNQDDKRLAGLVINNCTFN